MSTTVTLAAPEIGSIVEYGLDSFNKEPQTWRVQSWMREAPVPEFGPDDILDQILFEGCQQIQDQPGGKMMRMQWCLREEATHVALAGISGEIAPIAECKVIGMADWSEKALMEERTRALRLGTAHQMLF